MLEEKIPWAMVVIKVACGADKATDGSMPSRGIAPVNPYAWYKRLRTGAIATEPTTQPIRRATCCFQGVAPTNWPVFKSCKLSLEIAAIATTTEVMKRAIAVAN